MSDSFLLHEVHGTIVMNYIQIELAVVKRTPKMLWSQIPLNKGHVTHRVQLMKTR